MTVSIQQLLRIGVSMLWILSNVTAIYSIGNIYVTIYSVVSSNILFLTYYILANSLNISVVIYNIIGIFFVLQRILMLYLSPDNIAFLGKAVNTDPTSFELAIVFIAVSNLFIIFIARKYREPFNQSPIYHNELIVDVIKYYPVAFIALWIIKKIIQFTTGIGFIGFEYSNELGLFSRIIEIVTTPILFLYMGIFLFRSHNKLHIVGVILVLIDNLIIGSKGALLSFFCNLSLCYLFLVSYRVRVKYILLGCLLFIATFYYGQAAMGFRLGIIKSHFAVSLKDMMDYAHFGYQRIEEGMFKQYAQVALSRMGLLDWLAAFIHCGREIFNIEMNFHSLFISIANSIIPRSILPNPYIPPNNYITLIWTTVKVIENTGDVPGIYGCIYIYFGYGLGISVIVAWLWFSCYFVQKFNRLFGVLFVWQFVLSFMIDGVIDNHVRLIINIAVYVFIWNLFRKIVPRETSAKYIVGRFTAARLIW